VCTARTVSVPLAFLDGGRWYVAEVYRDGEQADDRNGQRFDLVAETKTVTAQDKLDVRLAPGGGLAIRLVPKA
jgi:alpha-glucosidase